MHGRPTSQTATGRITAVVWKEGGSLASSSVTLLKDNADDSALMIFGVGWPSAVALARFLGVDIEE